MTAVDDLAADVLERTRGDVEALRRLVDRLDRELAAAPLQRTARLWDVSTAQLGRMFGVSRQAAATWMAEGPPAARRPEVALLGEATDMLDRWVKRDRIPAVVRRPVELLGGRSRLDAALAGDLALVVAELRDTFDLDRIAP
jgi:hypothetical protein